MKSHSHYLNITLQIAYESIRKGNHPFGAILVHDGKVIMTGYNHVVTNNDVTSHAEINLIRKAQKEFDQQTLSESILFTSTEPCAMCSGAIYWSHVQNVVYGCSNEKLCSIVGGSLEISSEDIFSCGKKKISLRQIKHRSFEKIHEDFW